MSTRDKLETALNEARTLVLGAQITLGFQFNAVFQSQFEALPKASQWLDACASGLIVAAIGLLLAPVSYHRVVADGDATTDTLSFITAVSAAALLPFAATMVMDVCIVSRSSLGYALAGVIGAAALGLWYGVELMKRAESRPRPAAGDEHTDIHEKIRTINTESRIILPGVQALLGFQFSAFLMQGFEKLPEHAKTVHLLSLFALALAAVLLMAPAAYHRIAAAGNDRPDVDRFAVRMVLGAMLVLAAGLAGDLYLVLGMVSGWEAWAAGASLLVLPALWGFWFGYPLAKRR